MNGIKAPVSCHFELEQFGFTAAYPARQCLQTSGNTFILILRAGLLQPHGSESGTRHNRDFIRRQVRCSAFGSRCKKYEPFPSPTTKKCTRTSFSLGVKWASVARGAAPCHWHRHQGQATRDLAGWTAPQRASSSSKAKPQNQAKPPRCNS
jgi:hypothetical protein